MRRTKPKVLAGEPLVSVRRAQDWITVAMEDGIDVDERANVTRRGEKHTPEKWNSSVRLSSNDTER